MAGHTKGPWGDNDKPVVTRGLTFISHANYETEEGTANARLISAAPCLLEALREARDALHQHYVDWDGEPEDAVPLQLARAKCDAAIAKATQP